VSSMVTNYLKRPVNGRVAAGAFGFLTLIQVFDRPETILVRVKVSFHEDNEDEVAHSVTE
jgi:hypothetical protein